MEKVLWIARGDGIAVGTSSRLSEIFQAVKRLEFGKLGRVVTIVSPCGDVRIQSKPVR